MANGHTPTQADFTDPAEMLVRISLGQNPDTGGRVQFTAFWLDDYLPPDGVRGQVFNTNLDRFVRDTTSPVRVIA